MSQLNVFNKDKIFVLNIQKAMPTIVLELYESLSDGVYSFITFWIANVYTAFSSGDVPVCFKEKKSNAKFNGASLQFIPRVLVF